MTDDARGLTVRPLEPDERDAFRRITDYAFSPTDGPSTDEGDESAERIARSFGAFDDGELVSVCAHYDFTARLRGDWVPLAGLAAVATPPENRRQGYVREMVRASLDRWRGEYPLAALWPFDRGYYRQFGWETASRAVRYECPPEQLAVARGDASGAVERVTADEWERLRDAHEAYAADRSLTLRRDGEWWRRKVFQVDDDDRPYVFAWTREGRVRGYVAFSFEATGGGLSDRELHVADIAYADHEALVGLLGLLADHDSQAGTVVLTLEDAGLLDLVPDPSDVDAEVFLGPMVRAVDTEHALSVVPYPDGATASLALAVRDGTAPWNDGVVRLDVTDGEADCAPTDLSPREADATLDVGTLSALLAGYYDVADAVRYGDLDASAAAERALGDLFPPETTHLRTFF